MASNASLRLLDWRFLLPRASIRKTLCLARGPLAEALALISSEVAGAPDEAAGDCDLAVAVNPAPECLRRMWRALLPGGALYAEWTRQLPGSFPRLRRSLERAGYDEVAVYRPWPSNAAPQFWAPLDSAPVLAYLAKNRPRPKTLGRRLADDVRWACWRRGIWPGPRVCTIARKSLPAGTGGQGLNQMLRDRWHDLNSARPAHETISCLLLTGGSRAMSKVVALVFGGRGDKPALAVKIPRVEDAAEGLFREASNLLTLAGKEVRGIPRLLFADENAGNLMLGETALPGRPIYSFRDGGNDRTLALKATDWLISLAGHPEPAPCGQWWDRIVRPVLDGFERSFGPVVDPHMLRETEAALSAVAELPLVCEQRDFSPWNVFLDSDGNTVVFDWESAELNGLPALDLIYFLAYYGFEMDGVPRRMNYRDSYRASLNPATRTGSIRRECLGRYVDAIGLNPSAIAPLRLFVWLLHSRSEYRQFCDDAGGHPARETLRRSLFLSLWEEELHSIS